MSNGQTVTLRFVLLHLIEETARHNGHLDILREMADGGETGWPPRHMDGRTVSFRHASQTPRCCSNRDRLLSTIYVPRHVNAA